LICINYSGKSFNPFLVNENSTPADGSETKLIAGNNLDKLVDREQLLHLIMISLQILKGTHIY
jgi:hypothetical protein